MTLSDIWKLLTENPSTIPVIIVVLLSLIEVSKVKINPWSWIGGIIGKLLGIQKVSDKVDALEKKVDTLEEKVDTLDHKVEENDVIAARVRILRFQSEIEDQRFHSKDSWDQVMTDIVKYETYVEEHPDFKNGITEPTIEYLKLQYKERLERHDWQRRSN